MDGGSLLTSEVTRGQVVGMSVHGTGTPLGDPIEVGALAQVMSRKSNDGLPAASASAAALLSNKSCFGHTEGAAGELSGSMWPLLAAPISCTAKSPLLWVPTESRT